MPFIPHTTQDIKEMLAVIGASTIDQLYDEVPAVLPKADLSTVPDGYQEADVMRLLTDRAPCHRPGCCFIGAGAYEHYIPAAVWQIASRGEFYTAYTPYQAEASQGSLQLIYEYQTMMAELMAMDVSNASLYDGATALAEACLMALRLKKENVTQILVPETVHPMYRHVLQTILSQQNISVIMIPMNVSSGIMELSALEKLDYHHAGALVIPAPNFFGCLESVDELTRFAHQHGLLVIAVVNPIAMALLKPPGQWGDRGADIVCGEGQPLGAPLSYGGPYFGFMCCKKEYMRQMPGRIVGKTEDQENREGYTLTLQAREQHIRRAKATSNICTNQGLLVVAATIYLSLLGHEGLSEAAKACHHNTSYLRQQLAALEGVEILFSTPYFHEFVVKLSHPVEPLLQKMREQGIQAGYSLQPYYPELENTLLVCATETKTQQDLDRYIQNFALALQD